ncbi:pre-mRNA-splicing factor ISY1 homolog [Centruroides sculpturatus]|uniref:pre-mRNA-splicing factor ISY1 homolog n=1 Tax=Centruroides sculpturatus TaxID=218467 RepID=UPI000C6DE1FF|nr:pre-mRNA-splicing factor ISY1 homolog [Centruroides sculpturatus]
MGKAPPPPRKTRAELMKDVDYSYYGRRDDDDGILIPLEYEEEKKAIAEAVEEWKKQKKNKLENDVNVEKQLEDIYIVEPEAMSDEDDDQSLSEIESQSRFIAHVPIPSQKEIEAALVLRKKTELLQKYTSETLQEEAEEVKQLLGI